MRAAMIANALILSLAIAACDSKSGEASGPERRSAAGEVLGGEISDAMVPLDTVRSTSPVAPRTTASGANTDAQTPEAPGATIEERRAILPRPEVSGGPEPLPNNPNAEDAPSPPQI